MKQIGKELVHKLSNFIDAFNDLFLSLVEIQ